jgi:hypothetical protein
MGPSSLLTPSSFLLWGQWNPLSPLGKKALDPLEILASKAWLQSVPRQWGPGRDRELSEHLGFFSQE